MTLSANPVSSRSPFLFFLPIFALLFTTSMSFIFHSIHSITIPKWHSINSYTTVLSSVVFSCFVCIIPTPITPLSTLPSSPLSYEIWSFSWVFCLALYHSLLWSCTFLLSTTFSCLVIITLNSFSLSLFLLSDTLEVEWVPKCSRIRQLARS